MWEERPGSIPAVRTVWRAHVEAAGEYLIAGSAYWGISFIRHVDGCLGAELDGPCLTAKTVRAVVGESYWGVELAPFVVLAGFSQRPMLGETRYLPVQDDQMRIEAHRVTVPGFHDLEDWIADLIDTELLTVDEAVQSALGGDHSGASQRTWQRRFRRTVGLTAGQVEQVHRAERAYELLQCGITPVEAALRAGFADQAHLTRSLRLIRGRTPAAILADARSQPVRD